MNGIELETYHRDYEALKPQIQKHGWCNTPPAVKLALIRSTLFLQGQKAQGQNAPVWVDILRIASELVTRAIGQGTVTYMLLHQRPASIADALGAYAPATVPYEKKTIERPWNMDNPEAVGGFLRECLEIACGINHVDTYVFRDDIRALVANLVNLITPESPVSRVFKICDAYESGVGHGAKGGLVVNPYSDPELKEAFELGCKKGKEMQNEHS